MNLNTCENAIGTVHVQTGICTIGGLFPLYHVHDLDRLRVLRRTRTCTQQRPGAGATP